jgi:hypothetical protein
MFRVAPGNAPAACIWACAAVLGCTGLAGCASVAGYGAPLPAAFHENPVRVPARDHQFVWEQVVDVIDDYFRIAHEEPVRLMGNVYTEGRLETAPQVGATLLEPWRSDSASRYERWLSTLQSIRRRAVIRVLPAEEGFWVDVAVFKELEDTSRPELASAGMATFRNDSSLSHVADPIAEPDISEGWIPQGRDVALEQRIIGHLLSRFRSPVRTAPYAAPIR